MKTPMQELIDSYNENINLDPQVLCYHLRGKMQELLPKEKQAIIEARINDYPPNEISKNLGEQYFNEKYK